MDTPVQTEIQTVYIRPASLSHTPSHYCPGCTHGIAHRLIAEVMDEMDIREKTIGVAPVGCSVFAYNYFDFDWVEAAHGTRSCHGHRYQACLARSFRLYLPGRWRLGFHRHE